MYAVTLDGQRRTVLNVPGVLQVHDAATDGRLLVDRLGFTQQTEALLPGLTVARNVSWHDYTAPTDISSDGALMVFAEYGEAGSRVGTTYLRKTDGSPPIRLGSGLLGTLSPDGKWVATVQGGTGLMLLPTGVGQERVLDVRRFETINRIAWLPDGKRLLLAAMEPGERERLYIQSVDSAEVRPITPEGVGFSTNGNGGLLRISPDGRYAAALDSEFRAVLVGIDGGEVRPIAGVETGELPVGWTADGKGLYVFRPSVVPSRVFRIDVASGRRTLWREIIPRDLAGVIGLYTLVISPDGRSLFYSYQQYLSELYLVEGVK